MNVIEIQTIEGLRLEWVAIYGDTDRERLIRWGNTLLAGFTTQYERPYLRVLERQFGKVIGEWDREGHYRTIN